MFAHVLSCLLNITTHLFDFIQTSFIEIYQTFQHRAAIDNQALEKP